MTMGRFWIAASIAALSSLAWLTTAGARVVYEPRMLQAKVEDADAVYHVRVSEIVRETFRDGQTSRLCGTNYRVNVIERFKGRDRVELIFAVYSTPLIFDYEKVVTGTELLVLISEIPRNSDPYARVIPDVILPKPSAAHRACLSRLSPIRLSSEQEAAFILQRFPTEDNAVAKTWLGFASSATTMPDDPSLQLQPFFKATIRNDELVIGPAFWRVSWGPLKQRLLAWSCNR